MSIRAISVLGLFLFSSILFADTDQTMVSVEITQKTADLLAQVSFPDYNLQLFDTFSYYDLDDARIADVYVYTKSSQWLGKKDDYLRFLYSLSYETSLLENRAAEYNDINTSQSDIKAIQDSIAFKKAMLGGHGDFVTIYVSATKVKMPIWEYKGGVPESYYRYDLEKICKHHGFSHSNDMKIYYNGPMQLFIKDPLSNKVLSIVDDAIETSMASLGDYVFRSQELSPEMQDQKRQAWAELESKSLDQLVIEYGDASRSSHIIPVVPYFHQEFWNDNPDYDHVLFPAGGSCAVMAAASALFYHDPTYENLLPFAKQMGQNYTHYLGGFWDTVGVSIQNYPHPHPSGDSLISFGSEEALIRLAEKLHYDFEDGGTPVDWTNFNSDYADYTNNLRGLDFSFEAKRKYNDTSPHSFSEIKEQMDSNRPMIIRVRKSSWDDSINEWPVTGDHDVCLMAYDDNYTSWGECIGVYTNGRYDDSPPYSPVYWNYENLKSAQGILYTRPWTLKITPGGSFGDVIPPPSVLIPANNAVISPGDIEFAWQNNATYYYFQVSATSDFSSYLFNTMTAMTPQNVQINTPGTYYWRVAPMNSSGNWCDFGDTYAFLIPPAFVSIDLLSNTSMNTAEFSGNITLNGSYYVSGKGFVWGTSDNVDLTNCVACISSGNGSGNFSSTIYFLDITEYFFRSYATLNTGTIYSPAYQFMESGPPSLVYDYVTISDIQAHSAVGAAEVYCEYGLGYKYDAYLTQVGVIWNETGFPTFDDYTGYSTISDPQNGYFFSSLTCLADTTIYYARAYASNGYGTVYSWYDTVFITRNSNPGVPIVQTEPWLWGSYDALFPIEVTNSGYSSVTARGLVWTSGCYVNGPDPMISDWPPPPKLSDCSGFTVDGSGMGQFTSLMAPLQPSFTYLVSAYATNSYGTYYTEPMSILTWGDGNPYPEVITAGVTNITATSGLCSGEVTGNSASVSPVEYTGIEIRNLPFDDPDPGYSGYAVYADGGIGEFNCQFDFLYPNTTYYYKAFAVNYHGMGWGEEQTFTTNCSYPNVSLTDISEITSNSVLCAGAVVTDNGSEVIEKGFLWSTSTNPLIEDCLGFVSCGSGNEDFSCYVTNLSQNTMYYIKSYAINAYGHGYSEEQSFSTLLEFLDSPHLDISADTTSDSITIAWDPVNGATSYMIYASDDPSIPFLEWELVATVPSLSYTFTSNCERQFFRICASTDQ